MEQLLCTVQEYAWGDTQSIPHLLGVEPDGAPKAELWMGAHRQASSRLVSGGSLADLIDSDPIGALGPAVSGRFGQLPFLFKVLAAASPLSIQTHPTLEQAIAGYERENAARIPLDSPNRVYRDPNHKPELIAALTPFHAKCGFRPLAESRQLFSLLVSGGNGEELRPLTELLFGDGDPASVYHRAVASLLGGSGSAEHRVATATCRAAGHLLAVGPAAIAPFEAELTWTGRIGELYPGDAGVTVALLLNHVVLEAGEAIFLGAGTLHAYLSGVGMELMANSDNVVRGGLTPKHRDVDELLRVLDCSPIDVPVQRPTADTWSYAAGADEFCLDRLVDPAVSHQTGGPEILFVQNGEVDVISRVARLRAAAGNVIWVPASEQGYTIRGGATVWRARVPR